ncbi:MAG: hypothetical protein P4N60_00195 [Verrucomicrobiae bacterium]|nr:hypothetical protein [Verrucomicrobiae bacterium]
MNLTRSGKIARLVQEQTCDSIWALEETVAESKRWPKVEQAFRTAFMLRLQHRLGAKPKQIRPNPSKSNQNF